MKIFVTGATGFIGRHVIAALTDRGHHVICASRGSRDQSGCAECCQVDFTRDFDQGVWRTRLQGVDVVVNAVGIIREQGEQTFDALHYRAPVALFGAAHACGVRRVIQVSALGADEHAQTAYHRSKRAADNELASLKLDWVIVQPSLVFGDGGGSTQLFTAMASSPVIVLPGTGDYEVQPVHINDVSRALVALIEAPEPQRRRIALVGPAPITFKSMLIEYRRKLRLQPARVISLPRSWILAVASLARLLPNTLLTRESVEMLFAGNVSSTNETYEVLRREPLSFLRWDFSDVESARLSAMLYWQLPMLRLTLAIVWIVTGILSLGVYPRDESFALLTRAHVPQALSALALYSGAIIDLLLGVSTLFIRRKWLWWMQALVILTYTAIITVTMPEMWLHPFGPILKNIPLLGLIWLLGTMERR